MFSTLLESRGIMYDIFRNGEQIHSLKGLPNHEKVSHVSYIGFLPDSDIKTGDILDNRFHEKFIVTDTQLGFFHGEPGQLKVYYQTESEAIRPEKSSVTYNIGNAYGSVIGSQSVVNMNYNDSIQSAKQQISESSSPDKEDLTKLINLLEMVVNDRVPVHKGIFSKFSAVMERNSWITSSISSVLLNWLTSQIL